MNPVITTILKGVRTDIAAKVAKREAKEQEIKAILATRSHWSGHVCNLPQKERTYEGFYWRCGTCKQYWQIRVIANVHHWQTFGLDAFKSA